MATKPFSQYNIGLSRSLMLVDSLNLSFRYKHSKAVDFADDYMNTVTSLRRSYNCNKLLMLSDWGSSTFRKSIYPAYKQNRDDKRKNQTPEEEEDFKVFFAEFQEILQRYEIEEEFPVLRFKGVEADDIAAYIVKYLAGHPELNINHTWLISSDRDWNLLLSDKVSQFSYVTRKEYTLDNWSEHYEFNPEEYISIKCLMGDTGDNVMGVPGIGPKKAASLIQTYGSTYDIISALPIASRYKYIQALNEFGKENLLLNYQLMDLAEFCEEAVGIDNCKTIDAVLQEYLV